MTKRCEGCGNILMGNEQRGTICNECIRANMQADEPMPRFGSAEYWDMIEASGLPFYFGDSPWPDGHIRPSAEEY